MVDITVTLVASPALPTTYQHCSTNSPTLSPDFNFFTIWNAYGFVMPVTTPFEVICYLETYDDPTNVGANGALYALSNTAISFQDTVSPTSGIRTWDCNYLGSRYFARMEFVPLADCTIANMINFEPTYMFEVFTDCTDYTVAKTPYDSLPATDPSEETLAQG